MGQEAEDELKGSMGRQSTSGNRHSAILLIGPTGSGKTPVGDCLEKRGLWGHRCFHFDFGANLRKIAQAGVCPSILTDRDLAVVRQSLVTGRLLEDKEFHIAAKILQGFAEQKRAGEGDYIVLNGMPRHAGQARDVDAIANVVLVVVLECSSDVVRQRIASNVGGDREGRTDDAPSAIEEKLRIFSERTLPLLDHYRSKGVRIEAVTVGADTTPEAVVRLLEKRCGR
jgi:adenylate kinase family enzyme